MVQRGSEEGGVSCMGVKKKGGGVLLSVKY